MSVAKEKNIADNLNEMQNLTNFVENMPVMEFQDAHGRRLTY